MDKLQVRVVTPELPIHDGEADMVVVPAHDGEMGILPRHSHLLASLGKGALRVTSDREVTCYYLEGGFVQVSDNQVTVLCERACPLQELDAAAVEERARQAREAGAPEAASLERHAAFTRRLLNSSRNQPH